MQKKVALNICHFIIEYFFFYILNYLKKAYIINVNLNYPTLRFAGTSAIFS